MRGGGLRARTTAASRSSRTSGSSSGERDALVVDTGMGTGERQQVRRHARELAVGVVVPDPHAFPSRAWLRGPGVPAEATIRLRPCQADELRGKGAAYSRCSRVRRHDCGRARRASSWSSSSRLRRLGRHLELGDTSRAATWGLAHTRAIRSSSCRSSGPLHWRSRREAVASRSFRGSRRTTQTSTATGGSRCSSSSSVSSRRSSSPGTASSAARGGGGDRPRLPPGAARRDAPAGGRAPRRTTRRPSSTGRCAPAIRTGASRNGSHSAPVASTPRRRVNVARRGLRPPCAREAGSLR